MKRARSSKPSRNAVPPDCWELSATDLDMGLDVAQLGFRTTQELEPLDEVVGQERAIRALEFGLAVRHLGYNIYISGMSSPGRKQVIERLLQQRSREEATPDDWIYVYNFDEPDRPLTLRLPSGHGVRLRDALEEIVQRLRQDLPAALKAKDFDAERERLSNAYGKRSEVLFNELVDRARHLDMAIRRLPNGTILLAPMKDGRPMEPEEVDKLSTEDRADVDRRQQEVGDLAGEIQAKQQELFWEMRQEIEQIIRTFAARLLDPSISRLKGEHPSERLASWLDKVRDHLLDNLQRLQGNQKEQPTDFSSALHEAVVREDHWIEYRVNVAVDNARTQGAPVIVENSPTYKNLFGIIEHDVNLFGRVSTNFTRIKSGGLLQANGGYLVFDLEDALTEPMVWKQLKRTLESGELPTDVYEPFALFATSALKPEPIPVDTKVVVFGSDYLYYLLQSLDDFRDLFKVRAEFGPDTSRDAASHLAYARFIARQVQREKLLPFDAAAVGEIIRFGAREAGHRDKLSVELDGIADVIRESSHWAAVAGSQVVELAHVSKTLHERTYRSDRIAEKVRELIEEGTLRITIEGSRVGQVNGLSVWDLGDYSFGRPSRVTASAGVGREGLVNIERESDLSGKIHDKGVLILEGYLRNRYASRHPLALSAGITFEQSYGWVEGDSASSAELYCLLSAISGVPLRQDIAVTGSVNQHGEVQAIGGANEKIEGFFDVCRIAGLTGKQGVCIPRSNVRHLVLRHDVVEAVRAGHFHVWAIDTINEGIHLLTGMVAGDVDQEGSFHHRVDQRLQEILGALQEQPEANASLRVRMGPTPTPTPSPPPMPGEG